MERETESGMVPAGARGRQATNRGGRMMTTETVPDVVVIGSGLGALTAAALLARAGRKVCVLERNTSMGGAASCYKAGGLTIEASLHETADPHDPRDLKHLILKSLGILDDITWVPIKPLYTVRGGPFEAPFAMLQGFAEARAALGDRFPAEKAGIGRVLGRMEGILRHSGES